MASPRMSRYRRLARLFAYAWAAPNTALGLLAGLLMLLLGGRARLVSGVLEFNAGRLARVFKTPSGCSSYGAVTLGHVILGTSGKELAALRRHEHVHVRQYEHWGIFFLPAYALSSVWEAAHGRCAYRSNYFERQAYALADRAVIATAVPRP